MEKTKCAMITIAGRPNVGKSTLTNAIVGEKVAIVSSKPQTTRNRICAVLTRKNVQLIFVDTPGLHKPRTRLGDYMVKVVRESVADVDAVFLLVEPIANIGAQEAELIAQIKRAGVPAILVINKIDTVKPEELLSVIDIYSKEYEFDAVMPISAKSRDGVEELLKEAEKYAYESPFLFDDDSVSDQPERQIIAELIREKMLYCLEREVPHGTAVEITKFSERDNGIIDVDATIYCEKSGHKGIIIGKNGTMLKRIGEMARKDIEEFMGTKVFLQTWVKVKENWRDSEFLVKNFGYGKDE